MWQRIKTAIVLVLIVGVAMFATDEPYLFLPLLAVGVLIASHEWTKLMPKWGNPLVFVAIVFVLTMLSLLLPQTWLIWWAVSLAMWVLAAVWVKQYPSQDGWFARMLGIGYMGMVILTAAITAMYALWQMSAWWLLYVFVLVWCADSGAYFVGRKFGKRKLAPNVSPNKSMEGLFGGVTTAGIVAGLVGIWLGLTDWALALFLVLSGLTVGVSVLGDLFESMLKRRAGIKDSGNILPGHGGVLDRIDSLLSATPVFAFGFWTLLKLGVFDDTWVQTHMANLLHTL